MQDTFQWTDELVLEFANRRNELMVHDYQLEQFKSSKSPKKEPVLVTVDGVELFDSDYFFRVHKDFSISRYRGNEYNPDFIKDDKLFSTHKLATQHIQENKPLLSINDVKKIGEHSDQAKALAELTALVKQKLNQ